MSSSRRTLQRRRARRHSLLYHRGYLAANRGELAATYVMPDVIGVDGERAADALRRQGFRVSIVGTQPYPGGPPGIVVRQQPAGGFRVGGSDAISLEVSR